MALEERIKADLQRELNQKIADVTVKVEAVLTTDLNNPNLVSDLAEKVEAALKASADTNAFAVEANLSNPKKKEFAKIFAFLRSVDSAKLPPEFTEYYRKLNEYLNINRALKSLGPRRAQGIYAALYENTLQGLEDAQAALGNPDVSTQYVAIKTHVEDVLSKQVPPTDTEGIEDLNVPLEANRARVIANFFDRSATLPTPLDLSMNQADLESLLRRVTAALDSDTVLPSSDQQKLVALVKELTTLERDRQNELAAVTAILPLRIFISESLDRNASVRHEEFFQQSVSDRAKLNQVGYFLRPTNDVNIFLAGRDQTKFFLDLIGRDTVEWIEELAEKIANSADKSKSISDRDAQRLHDILSQIDNIQTQTTEAFNNAGSFDGDSPIWSAASAFDSVGGSYTEWIAFLLEASGRKHESDESNRSKRREPSRQDALDKWEEYYFEEFMMRSDAYRLMEIQAKKIFGNFYRSADPKESWKSELEINRFSGWKNALSTRADQLKAEAKKDQESGDDDRKAEALAKIQLAESFEYLRDKFDHNRKIVDAMVTYGQSRSMTASWDKEETRKGLVSAVGEREFSPESIDFFRENYKYSKQFNEVVRRLMEEAINPEGEFSSANSKWRSDNTTRNALRDKMTEMVMINYPDIPEEDAREISMVAYAAMTFAAANMDAFAEVHILGFSPNVSEIQDRLKYYRIAPFVEYFYGAYKEPRFLVEMQGVYKPTDLYDSWKARYASHNEPELDRSGNVTDEEESRVKKSGDYRRRINSIERSVFITEEVFNELAPLRKQDQNPIGYAIERNSDGMLKWPYASMYRFLFDPEYVRVRNDKKGGKREHRYTFDHWAKGYEGFVEFRDTVYTDISTEGKNKEQAITFLMGKLGKVTDVISKLKVAQELVDWNYIFVLTMSFIDRMYISLHDSGNSDPFTIGELENRISKMFGYQGRFVERKIRDWALSDAEHHGAPDLSIEQNKNNLNTAGKVDIQRLKPLDKREPRPVPPMPPRSDDPGEMQEYDESMKTYEAELKAYNARNQKDFLTIGLRTIRTYDGKDGDRQSLRRRMKFHVSHLFGHGSMGKIAHFIEDRTLRGMMLEHPNFEGTIDILSSTVDAQAKPKGEEKK